MPPTRPLWRQHDYLLWLAGDTGSALSSAVSSFALPLVIAMTSGSVPLGGAVASAYLVGQVAAGLPGGVIADRFDRRLLLFADALTGGLVWLAFALAFTLHATSALVLVSMGAIAGARGGMFTSLTNTCLKSVVNADQLPEASATNQGRDAVVGLAGGPLGGLLLAVGPAVPFGAAAALAISTLLPAVGVRASFKPPPYEHSRLLAGLREAAAWALRSPLMRVLMGMAFLLNFALNGLASSMLFSYVNQGLPGWQLGLLEASAGLGMLVGAVLAAKIVRGLATGIIVIGGVGWVCLGGAALALELPIVAACLVFGMVGLGLAPVNAALGGLLTTVVPSERLGRVSATLNTGALALSALAPLLAAVGVSTIGRTWTGLVFVVVLAAGLAVALANPQLRRLPRADAWSHVRL